PKLQLAARVQPIQTLLSGPDKGVKRCSGHRTFPVSALFPTVPQFLPTPRSIPKRRLTGKERASCRDDQILTHLFAMPRFALASRHGHSQSSYLRAHGNPVLSRRG